MPASIEQSYLFVLVTRCWSSFVFQDQYKGNIFYAMHDKDDGDMMGEVHGEASLTLETFGDTRTTNTRHR